MSDRPYQNKDWLYEKYYTEGLTTEEIAELPESCNRRCLNTWLNRNGIQRIQNPELPYESLVEQYHEVKSIYRLAEKYNVDAGTISSRLKSLGCNPDNSGPTKTPANFNHHDNGYGNLYERVSGSCNQVYVHQLLAISEGADVDKVFSSGNHHVHHKNEITWDNRPENIELLSAEEHAKEHHG
jgi:hypothetical protein